MPHKVLPIPDHFNPGRVGDIWKVDYQHLAAVAEQWVQRHHIEPAARDRFRVCLVLIDIQNTFCIPGFELYVGGVSGTGAVDDNRRLCEFIYRHLHLITRICPTMDTHQAAQIFHSVFFVDENGEHPPPYTLISNRDIEGGRWRFNPDLAESLKVDPQDARQYLLHYTSELKKSGKYDLTIWPYHAMLGGIGHALVPAVEAAVFFHGMVRRSQTDFQIKGGHPLTENYSVLSPEVRTGADNAVIAEKNEALLEKLAEHDAVVIAGQAKSHCVAWTVEDLLNELLNRDRRLVGKVYLLEDCTSPVVIPGVIDYTDPADTAFKKFADAGMHLVRSTDPLQTWPGFN